MSRTFLFAALCFCVPALAADPQDYKIDAQRDLNQGKRKAANDELKAERQRSGNQDLTSLEVELRNQLGDDWTIRKSGSGYLAMRVTPKKADTQLTQRISDQMRDYRDHYKDAQATRKGDEIMLRGRIDDCGDVARAAQDFAAINGVNRIFIDLSCSPNR